MSPFSPCTGNGHGRVTELQGYQLISRNLRIIPNQPINQLINHITNQSIGQSINQSIISINQSKTEYQRIRKIKVERCWKSVPNQPINQSINRSISKSINQSNDQLNQQGSFKNADLLFYKKHTYLFLTQVSYKKSVYCLIWHDM